ncbi:MAG: hypothetical protein K8E66_00605, partial [Phycisphaerales bacterium]|nr:hypothetical protein [Phycisphaerales bacterium]
MRAWGTVVAAVNDATVSLVHNIDFRGAGQPELNEPLPAEKRVERAPLTAASPRLAVEFAKLLGYFTPSERALHETLRSVIGPPRPLEEADKVAAHRHPVLRSETPGGQIVRHAIPELRTPEERLRQYIPLLSRPDMSSFVLAVSAANLKKLAGVSAYLRGWRPERVVERTLDPNWRGLVRTYCKVERVGVGGAPNPVSGLTAQDVLAHSEAQRQASQPPTPPVDAHELAERINQDKQKRRRIQPPEIEALASILVQVE